MAMSDQYAGPTDHAGDTPTQVLGRRAVAIVLDGIVLVAIWAVIALATGGVDNGDDGLKIETKTGGTLLTLAIWFLYFTALEGGPGRTVGKILLGVQVRARDGGGRAGYGRAAIRTVLRVIDVLPTFYLVGWICAMATGPDRRARLGDLAGGTEVVRRA